MSADGATPAGSADDSTRNGGLGGTGGSSAAHGLSSWLTRGRLAAILVSVAALVLVVLLLAVFAPGWWSGSGGSYAPRTIVSSGTITPRSSLFGDPLTAEAKVIIDPRLYDPASIQLSARFRPYVVRSSSQRITRGVGRASVVVFDYSIQCLTGACIPFTSASSKQGTSTKIVEFPPARLTAHSTGGGTIVETVPWSPIVVHSRLSAGQIALATPKIDSRIVLPAVTWRISPNVLGALALVAAVLLGLAAVWLVSSVAVSDSRLLVRRLRVPLHLTPVERALLLAEHASAAGERDEERKALQRLAVELRLTGRDELAGRAGRLAWSEESPSPELVGSLASVVRSGRG
jgi:hypothetical protein